jgi:transposase InsO family protein
MDGDRLGVIGAQRVHEDLVDEGERPSLNGVARVMRDAGLHRRAGSPQPKRPQSGRPGAREAIMSTDRGDRFSGAYQRLLASNGLIQSMRAVDHEGDNAACDGFFGLLTR